MKSKIGSQMTAMIACIIEGLFWPFPKMVPKMSCFMVFSATGLSFFVCQRACPRAPAPTPASFAPAAPAHEFVFPSPAHALAPALSFLAPARARAPASASDLAPSLAPASDPVPAF